MSERTSAINSSCESAGDYMCKVHWLTIKVTRLYVRSSGRIDLPDVLTVEIVSIDEQKPNVKQSEDIEKNYIIKSTVVLVFSIESDGLTYTNITYCPGSLPTKKSCHYSSMQNCYRRIVCHETING